MLTHIPFPVLPAPPSWFPGHMNQFKKMLPGLLKQTDVILELRDARLPLTSINRTFEGALQKWKQERAYPAERYSSPRTSSLSSSQPRAACEHIVVFSKRDLVPEWGIEPFKRAMASKFPYQSTFFASWHRHKDIKALNEMLVNIANEYPHIPELNVMVVGMPNVGKSTLLNALRNTGIRGPTPKALRTSSQPGLTRAVSTRLKLSVDPLVYAYDSPGVMLPFIGKGDRGAERGVKMALIAGIKEGLYNVEVLASYLLYRLNVLNPIAPAYLKIFSHAASPTIEINEFLNLLADRLHMLKRGGIRDLARAAEWFIKWWREEGGLVAAAQVPLLMHSSTRRGWGFDLEWCVDEVTADGVESEGAVQRKMEEEIQDYLVNSKREEKEVSSTQEKKKVREILIAKRATKVKARTAARKVSGTKQ